MAVTRLWQSRVVRGSHTVFKNSFTRLAILVSEL